MRAASEPRAEGAAADTSPAYLTASQLADLLQVDTTSVYRWAQQEPSMPVLRVRGVVRFPRERVLRWLAEHEQGQAQPRRKAAPDQQSVANAA